MNEQERRETRLLEAASVLTSHTGPSLGMIIGCPDSEYGVLVGSGTFLKQAETVFMVTAAHVAFECRKFRYQAHSAAVGRPVALFSKPFNVIGKPSDLALVEIDPQTLAPVEIVLSGTSVLSESSQDLVVPFDISVLAESSQDLRGHILFVHGFVGNSSRFSRLAGGLVSESLPYATFLSETTLPEFNPRLHFAIEYRPEGQKDQLGRDVYLPPPPGLSGAAVWRAMHDNQGGWDLTNPKIVGVVHKWYPADGTLIATRVEALRELLNLQAVKGADKIQNGTGIFGL